MSIKVIESQPISDGDIRRVLGSDAKIIKYSSLSQYNKLTDLLPNPKDFLILLYEETLNNGHFVGLLRYNGIFEYFDSYALPPEKPLLWYSDEEKNKLGQRPNLLMNLFNTTNDDVIYNTIVYQNDEDLKDNYDVSTCGKHVLFRITRLMNNDLSLPEYHQKMKQLKKITGYDYDEIVSLWYEHL